MTFLFKINTNESNGSVRFIRIFVSQQYRMLKKTDICFSQFMQRVVITGIGAITPFGVGIEHCFSQLVNSCCAIKVRIVFDFLCSD